MSNMMREAWLLEAATGANIRRLMQSILMTMRHWKSEVVESMMMMMRGLELEQFQHKTGAVKVLR